MAVFKLSKVPKVNIPTKLPAVLYAIHVYSEVSEKDIMAYENYLNYQRKKYPFISHFVGVSNTDSKTAFKHIERTGKRGRPKTKVDGNKVKRHVHIGVMGNAEKSGYSVAKNVANSINKRAGKKITKIQPVNAGFINYVYSQSDTFHQGGDFDFINCDDDYYLGLSRT